MKLLRRQAGGVFLDSKRFDRFSDSSKRQTYEVCRFAVVGKAKRSVSYLAAASTRALTRVFRRLL
jgi:hypothetical protein